MLVFKAVLQAEIVGTSIAKRKALTCAIRKTALTFDFFELGGGHSGVRDDSLIHKGLITCGMSVVCTEALLAVFAEECKVFLLIAAFESTMLANCSVFHFSFLNLIS